MGTRWLNDKFVSIALFAAILSGYLLSGNRAPFDSALYLHTALSIVREGNTDLDEYPEIVAQVWWPPDEVDGHRYDTAPIGTPVLAVPIVWAVDRAWAGRGDFQDYLKHNFPVDLQSNLASVIVALTAVGVYHIGRRRLTRPSAVLLALIFAFGTSAWSVVSRTLWQHGPSMLLLTLTIWIVLRAQDRPARIQYAGLTLALAYVTRPTNSVAVLACTLWVLLVYRRWWRRYLLWAAAVAVPFVAYSLTTYHTWLPPYYRAFTLLSGATFGEALVGQWLSPSRGLLIFSPILGLAPIGLLWKLRRRQWQSLDTLFVGIIGLHWVVVSLWWNWWAGVSYGPRIWSDMLPFLIWFVIPPLSALAAWRGLRRAAAWLALTLLLAFSVGVHYRGANAPEVMDWNGRPAPIDAYPQRVWDWRDPQWLYGLRWGTPVDLVVSGLPAVQLLDADLWARLGTNTVRTRQTDIESALIAPPGDSWLALADNQVAAPELASLLSDLPAPVMLHTLNRDNPPYQLRRFNLAERILAAAQSAEQKAGAIALPVSFGDTAALLGYQIDRAGETLTLITYWRAGEAIVTPLQMFVHVLGPDGSIVAQVDRLDASPDGWRPGDVIAQVHRLTVPEDLTPVSIAIGLYNPESGERLPVLVDGQAADNRLVLSLVDGR
jgi:hypothetical protein